MATPSGIVIGDSITARGKDELQPMRTGWVIDGVPGRRVSQLGPRITENTMEYGWPKVMTMALGQNDTAEWTKDDYKKHALRATDKGTAVVFVTPYRGFWPGPELTDFEEDVWNVKAARQTQYAAWMKDISRWHEGIFIADWRALCESGAVTLEDQSHPDEASQLIWAELIRDTATIANQS